MGLVRSIDGLVYTGMSLVSETDYTTFPIGWRPDHEKALLEYISLDDSKTLEELQSSLREQGLFSSQDYISMLVWNYKWNTIVVDQLSASMTSGNNIENGKELLLGSNDGSDKRIIRDDEVGEERCHAAQI